MGKPCIPLGHAEKFRKCIDAKLGSYACFPCENSDSDGGIEWILLQCCQSSSELL